MSKFTFIWLHKNVDVTRNNHVIFTLPWKFPRRFKSSAELLISSYILCKSYEELFLRLQALIMYDWSIYRNILSLIFRRNLIFTGMVATFQARFAKWFIILQLQNDTTVSFKDLAFVNYAVIKFYKHSERWLLYLL